MSLDQETEHARLATSSERSRLARELHDVVGHSLSLMTVQAAGARRIIEADPERAAAAIAAVERSGREALMELRRLLTLLGPDGSVEAELHAPPSMENLPALISQMNRAGVQAVLHVEGSVRALPTDVDLCAYRIIQEGLTNVIKHVGGCRADVTVRYEDDALELDIRDQGRRNNGARLEHGGTGRGLAGLRQRVAELGGRCEVGFYGGGYRIRARLPIDR